MKRDWPDVLYMSVFSLLFRSVSILVLNGVWSFCSYRKVSRAQREREERQKEEELAQQQQQQQQNQADEQGDQQPFVPPGDNNLIQYVEEVKDRIGPLPTTKDQVVALAVWVILTFNVIIKCLLNLFQYFIVIFIQLERSFSFTLRGHFHSPW